MVGTVYRYVIIHSTMKSIPHHIWYTKDYNASTELTVNVRERIYILDLASISMKIISDTCYPNAYYAERKYSNSYGFGQATYRIHT